jgi:hypothetical protein
MKIFNFIFEQINSHNCSYIPKVYTTEKLVKAKPEGYHSITPYLVVNIAGMQYISISVHLKPEKLIDIVVLMEKIL